MAWTRRRFLSRATVLGTSVLGTSVLGTSVLGAGFTAGCSSRVGGSPRPDPEVRAATETAGPARTVRLGILSYPPYTIENGGEVTGPVPEVARAVLGQLGVGDVRIQLMRDEAALPSALAAGQLDMVGGLAIRKELCSGLAFSVPDHVSGTALMVPAGNPKSLATYADVTAKQAKVAVMTNLPEQADAATAGVPAASIVPLPDPLQLVDAVRRGQVDCAAFDDLSSRALVRSTGGAVTVAAPFAPPGRLPLVGAYAFPKDGTDLLDAFDNRLRDLHASGDWMAIVAPFGLTEANVPPPDLTVEKACAG